MKLRFVALLVLACIGWQLTGCQTPQARQQQEAREYTHKVNHLIAGYATDVLALNAKYVRVSTPLSRKGKLAKLADEIAETAKVEARLAARLNSLKPPSGQAQVHAVMVDFFVSSSLEDSRWAAAIRSGDRKAADRVSQQIDRTNARYFDRLKKLGVTLPPGLRDALH